MVQRCRGAEVLQRLIIVIGADVHMQGHREEM